jgi:hypothetical protein
MGRYGAALTLVNTFLTTPSVEKIHQKHWQNCIDSKSTLPAADYRSAKRKFSDDLKFILVHESEWARQWRNGPEDHLTAHRNYRAITEYDKKKIKNAIEKIRRFDQKHAFLLRSSFDHALQNFLSSDKPRRAKIPNANAENGYEWRDIAGPKVVYNEFQFANRVSLFHFDELFDLWERKLEDFLGPWRPDWLEFGALRFANPVTPKAAAKMNVVQLGLTARLSSRLRDFTASRGLCIYGTGRPIPSDGKPCWAIVAAFLNSALDTRHDDHSIRRVWQSFEKIHDVTLQSWPNPAKRELQVQKK